MGEKGGLGHRGTKRPQFLHFYLQRLCDGVEFNFSTDSHVFRAWVTLSQLHIFTEIEIMLVIGMKLNFKLLAT